MAEQNKSGNNKYNNKNNTNNKRNTTNKTYNKYNNDNKKSAKKSKWKDYNNSSRTYNEVVNVKKDIKVPAFATAMEYIGKMCIILLAFVALVVDVFYIYYKYINKDDTIGTNYIDDQTGLDIKELVHSDDLTDEEKEAYEERVLFNVNIYDNSNNNGEKLYELRLDYFTDTSLNSTAYRSTGMQIKDYTGEDYWEIIETTNEEAQTNVIGYGTGIYYYDSVDGISFDGGNMSTQLNRDQKLIIKIDNTPYEIQVTGTKKWDTEETSGWWIFKKTTIIHNTLHYNYATVFKDCMKAVESGGEYGDHYITVDLSNLFTLKKYNEEKKIFEEDATDVIKSYAVLKYHYEKNGMKNAKQSMFGKIELDNQYGIDQNEYDTDMWRVELNYNLTAKDLEYRLSSVKGGFLAYLDVEKIKILNDAKHALINITIDLDANISVVGLDYSAFENLKINSITITSNSNRDFYVMDNALSGCGIDDISHSDTVNIIYSDNAFGTMEVVA